MESGKDVLSKINKKWGNSAGCRDKESRDNRCGGIVAHIPSGLPLALPARAPALWHHETRAGTRASRPCELDKRMPPLPSTFANPVKHVIAKRCGLVAEKWVLRCMVSTATWAEGCDNEGRPYCQRRGEWPGRQIWQHDRSERLGGTPTAVLPSPRHSLLPCLPTQCNCPRALLSPAVPGKRSPRKRSHARGHDVVHEDVGEPE